MMNLQEVKNASTLKNKMDATIKEVKRLDNGEGVYISDCLASLSKGGALFLEFLGKDYFDRELRLPDVNKRRKFYIKVLNDKWGNPVKEGDIIKLRYRKKLDKTLKHINYFEEELMSKLSGTYEEDFYDVHELTVDKNGCVVAWFEDAVRMLNNNGIHGRSGRPLTNKPQHSIDKVNAPDGSKQYVYYWLYKELTRAEYEALQPVKELKKTKKRKTKNKTENKTEEKNNQYKDNDTVSNKSIDSNGHIYTQSE